MQVQVFKKDTQELIAWVDVDNSNVGVVHKDYEVRLGNNLQVVEVDNESERVSTGSHAV